jgi:hypothetical protein
MELFTVQAIATGVEAGGIPKALERYPGFVTSPPLVGFIAINRFHDEAHPRPLRKSGALIWLEDAVLEGGCHDLNHVFTFFGYVSEVYPIGATRASCSKRWCNAAAVPASGEVRGD